MINQSRGKLVIPNRQIASRPDRSLSKTNQNLVKLQQAVVTSPNNSPALVPQQEVTKTDTNQAIMQPTKALPTIPVMQTTVVAPVQPKPLPPAKRVVDSLVLPTKKEVLDISSQPQPIATPMPVKNTSQNKVINSLNQEQTSQAQPPKETQNKSKSPGTPKKQKKGFHFFKSKASLGVSLLMISGLSGALGYATWQITGIFVEDQPTDVAVLGASDHQDLDKIEVLEINGHALQVVSQPTLSFTKTQILEPNQALFSEGVFWADHSMVADLQEQSRVVVKKSSQPTEYRYKNTWQIDQLTSIASVLPAKKEINLVGYNQTTDTWSVVIFEQL